MHERGVLQIPKVQLKRLFSPPLAKILRSLAPFGTPCQAVVKRCLVSTGGFLSEEIVVTAANSEMIGAMRWPRGCFAVATVPAAFAGVF